MTASPLLTATGSVNRGPELRRLCRSEMKLPWQHPDDDVWKAIQCHRLPQHIRPSSVPFLPGGVAQDDRAGRRGQVLAGMEIAAKRRRNAERAEESVAHASATRRLCAGGNAQQEPPA